MKKSQKLLVASLVTLPVAVVMAVGVQAAETTTKALTPLDISNSFITKSTANPVESKEDLTVTTRDGLHKELLKQMQGFKNGFTITYEAGTADNYKADVEAFFEDLKAKLNTEANGVDYTLLYGAFKNVKVEATEIATTDGGVTTKTVKLKFSFNYSMQHSAQTALNNLATQLTAGGTGTIITTSMTDLQKIKAVHDYVVFNSSVDATNNNLSALVLDKKGSANAYALLMYKLLKTANIEARYVAGVSGEGLRAWNLVKVGGKWYHLDAGSNDNTIKGSKHISYQYFLASNVDVKGRMINYGGSGIGTGDWGIAFSAFKNIVNPAQANNVLYYADAQSGGAIKKLDMTTTSVTNELVFNGGTAPNATSGFGKIVYYTFTSGDSASAVIREDLYFINDAVGGYLYKYNLTNKDLKVIINESVTSIELDRARLYYTTAAGTKSILLTDIGGFNKEAAKTVIDAIAAIDDKALNFKQKVMEARQKYNLLTEEQKQEVTNIMILQDYELEIATNIGTQIIISLINTINNLNVLNSNYVDEVKEAKTVYDKDLNADQRAKVYNYQTLDQAYKQVKAAESLNVQISELVVSDKVDPFETEGFINEIEQAAEQYANLLPSLKLTIEVAQSSFLGTYIGQARILRQAVNELINNVNIIDSHSVGYLTLMETIKNDYTGLKQSQKSLLTDGQTQKIIDNIEIAAAFEAEIIAFREHILQLGGIDATTVITAEQATTAKLAKKMYDNMNPSQRIAVQSNETQLLLVFGRVNTISDGTAYKKVIQLLEELNYKAHKTVEDFTTAVSEAEDKLEKLREAEPLAIEMISTELKNKLGTYRKILEGGSTVHPLSKVVEDVQLLINELDDESEETDVIAVRDVYKELSEIQQHFVKVEELIKQETRIAHAKTDGIATETAKKWDSNTQTVLDKKGKSPNADLLKEMVELLESYKKLTLEAQKKTTKKEDLDTLKGEIETSEAFAIAEAKKVTNSINALKASSKKEEIDAVRKAYDALSTLAKSHVTEATVKLLEAAEKTLADEEKEEQDKKQETEDKAKALELDNAILAIGADTLLEDIEALYAEYGALSATIKAQMKEGNKLETTVKQRREQEVQDTKTAQDQAKLVYDRIEKITGNYTEAQIRNIRTAYAALSARAKTYVTNLVKLSAAEANINYQDTFIKEAKNEAEAFDTYMTNLDHTSSTADIVKARAYYNRLSAEARKHVTAYTKLERLETMWSKKEYQDLYNNYYPHYIDEIPAGGIEVGQQKPVSLYIPDDSGRNAAYTAYTGTPASTHHNGITITAEQIRHMNDRTLTLTASDNIKISIPVEELKNTKGTVAVYADVSNGSLIVRFTEDNVVKTFSGFVEIKLPMSELSMTTANVLERTTSTSSSTAVNYYFDGKDIVIRTKQSGTFTSKNNTAIYNDLLRVNTDAAKAIRELAKRNITSGAIGKSYLPNSTAKRKDIAIMIAKAIDVATIHETKMQDIQNLVEGAMIQALVETSIMKGKTTNQFSPYANVTRQEGAIILANMLRYLNVDLTKSHNEQTSNYTDVNALTYEAKQSISILEKAGVLSGEGLFNPTAPLSRAEFAELLYKSMQNAKLL